MASFGASDNVTKLLGAAPAAGGISSDRINELYHREIWEGTTQAIARDRIHWMCSVAKGTRVLDVGCSQGIASILLAREGFEVVGIDSDPHAIRYALTEREREVAPVKHRLSFVEIELRSFAEHGFDTVLLGEVIEHQVSPRRFVELCAGKVAPDGLLVLTTPFGLHPHPDHKATLFPRDVVEALGQAFEIETIDVVAGYIRCTAVRRQERRRRQGGGIAAPPARDAQLLKLTESATFESQVKLRSLLDQRRDLIEAKTKALVQAEARAHQSGQSLAEARRELAMAQEEARARTAEAEAGRAELDRLQAQLGQTARNLDAELGNVQLERKARLAAEAETANAETRLAEATARAEASAKAAEAARREAEAGAAEAAEKTARLHAAERQRVELERRVADLEQQVERLERAHRTLQAAAAAAANANEESLRRDAAIAVADLEAELRATRGNANDALARLLAAEQAELAHAAKVAQAEERAHALARELDQERTRAATSARVLAERERELAGARGEAAGALDLSSRAEQRCVALEAERGALTVRIAGLSREAEHANAQVERLRTGLRKAESELAERAAERARLGAEHEQSMAALEAEHKRALSEVERQLRNGRSELETRARDNGGLRTEVDRLRKALALTEQKADNIRRTLSFRLGHLLIKAPKSPRNLARLPRQLLELRREAKRRRLAGRDAMPEVDRAHGDAMLAELRSVYAEQGLEAALARVEAGGGRPAERAHLLTGLAKFLAGFDPANAATLARRAHALDARPFRSKWLAFLLFDGGAIREPAQLIDSLPAGLDLKPSERTKIAQIRGQAALLEQQPALPARRPAVSTPRPRTALYLAASALPYHVSGYTTRTQSLLGALARAGWQVTCLMRPGYPDDRADALQPVAGEQHRLGEVLYLRAAGPHAGRTELGAYIAEAAAAIERRARDLRPALVHAASNHVNALPALIAARRLGIPFVYEVRGLWEHTTASRRVDWEASERFRLARDLETLVAREADLVLTLSKALVAELSARGVPSERIRLVPNCVDPDAFAPRPKDAELAQRQGLSAGAFTVVYVGSVVAYEGLDDLVRAIARLAAEGIDAQLVIAGDGDGMETLRRLVGELKVEGRVHLVGRIAPEAAPRWLSLADAVALPRKAFKVCELVAPLKPLEAMAMAKPVVVSDVRAQLELVEDGVSGLVHKAGDFADLARQLARLAADPALAQRLATTAREHIARERTWPAAAARVVEAYDALLGITPGADPATPTTATPGAIPLPKGRNAFTAGQKQEFLQRLAQAYEHGGADQVRRVAERQAAGRPAPFLSFCLINAARQCKQQEDVAAAAGLFRKAARIDPRPSTLRSVAKALYGIPEFKGALDLLDGLAAVPGAATEADQAFAEQVRGRHELVACLPARRPGPALIRSEPGRSVYFLHNSLPHASAGYATRSHGLSLAILDAGYDVRPYTRPGFPLDEKPELADAGLPDSDHIDGLTYRRLFAEGRAATALGRFLLKATDGFEEVLRRERPAVVHAASNYLIGLPALIAARRLGLPFVYEVRGLWELTRSSRDPSFKGSTNYRHMRFFESLVGREADHLIAITSALRDEMVLRGADPERITLVHNSVDPERFRPLARDEALADRLGFAVGVPVIGYVGSFVDYEGLDDLVRAAAMMRAQGVDFRLLLVGDGTVSEQVRDLVATSGLSDQTVLPGRVPHDEVEAYYSLIHICPFPRKPLPVCEVVSPLKPFEALAMEKALVVPDVQALAEIVADGETGLVYRKGDVGHLAETLTRLIKDPELTARLGRQGRRWVIENRTWKRAGKLVVGVYDRIRAKGSGSVTERAA